MDNPLAAVVGRLRQAAAVQTLGALPDRELLERFVAANDGAAFAALVERHGPLVFGVCRRALACRHDAEDACQAVFLVLARRASTLTNKSSLAAWLHGVARRVAANARRDAALRRQREAGAIARIQSDPAEEVTWREVSAALDVELDRLPERYRAPVVLCCLGCLTRDEAAAQLGLSPGALHGRLERGRQMLRARLEKRGVGLPAAMTAAGLVDHALSPMLAVKSANAAVLFAAGQPLTGVVGSHALELAKEVLMSLSMSKAKLYTAAVCVAVCAVLVGGTWLPVGVAQETKPQASSQPVPQKGDSKSESDEEFIRRMSKDLRGSDPTPAEIHFFTTNKVAGKRQKLIDLFIAERQAAKEASAHRVLTRTEVALSAFDDKIVRAWFRPADRLEGYHKDFYKELLDAKTKEDIAKVTQSHLDRMITFVKDNPQSPDLREAIYQIVLLYEWQGKSVEAGAWRSKLKAMRFGTDPETRPLSESKYDPTLKKK